MSARSKIFFFVEEPSMNIFLRHFLPKLKEGRDWFHIFEYQGCENLLKELPTRMKGFRGQGETYGLVVLVDEDRQDCHERLNHMEQAAINAGLTTQKIDKLNFQVFNWVIVEELEAWYFGDPEALQMAYPKLKAQSIQSKFPAPDAIKGGTWEALERLLQSKGYHKPYLRKWDAADEIAPHMDPTRNNSPSFQGFLKRLQPLLDSLS